MFTFSIIFPTYQASNYDDDTRADPSSCGGCCCCVFCVHTLTSHLLLMTLFEEFFSVFLFLRSFHVRQPFHVRYMNRKKSELGEITAWRTRSEQDFHGGYLECDKSFPTRKRRRHKQINAHESLECSQHMSMMIKSARRRNWMFSFYYRRHGSRNLHKCLLMQRTTKRRRIKSKTEANGFSRFDTMNNKAGGSL